MSSVAGVAELVNGVAHALLDEPATLPGLHYADEHKSQAERHRRDHGAMPSESHADPEEDSDRACDQKNDPVPLAGHDLIMRATVSDSFGGPN